MLNFEHNLCLLAKISYILSSIAIYTCHMYFVFQFFISRIFSLYHIFYFSESSFFSYLDPWMSEKSQSHFPTFFFSSLTKLIQFNQYILSTYRVRELVPGSEVIRKEFNSASTGSIYNQVHKVTDYVIPESSHFIEYSI